MHISISIMMYLTRTLKILLHIVRDSVLLHCVLSESAYQRLEGGERVFGRGPFEPPTQQGSEAVNRLPSVLLFDDIQNVYLEPEGHPYLPPFSRGLSDKAQ